MAGLFNDNCCCDNGNNNYCRNNCCDNGNDSWIWIIIAIVVIWILCFNN